MNIFKEFLDKYPLELEWAENEKHILEDVLKVVAQNYPIKWEIEKGVKINYLNTHRFYITCNSIFFANAYAYIGNLLGKKGYGNNVIIPKPKILHLSVHKKAFEVMVTGEKKEEYRLPSEWIRSRLFENINKRRFNRKYDLIKFTNGYGKDKPYFICKFMGFSLLPYLRKKEYSNGLILDNTTWGQCLYMIKLGDIVEKGNVGQQE